MLSDRISKDGRHLSAAEAALRESEQRFRATFEQAAVGMAHVAPDGKWLRANRKFSEIVGYSVEELSQLNFRQITHPDDQEASGQLARQLLDNDVQTASLEKRYVHKDGSIIWVNLTTSLLRGDVGEPEYFISVYEDISDRKRTELLLLEQNRLLELIASGTPLDDCLSSLCATVPRLNPAMRASVLLADDQRQSFKRPINDRLISTPILGTNGRALGSFFLFLDEPRAPSEWELRLAAFGVHIASIAVERDQSSQALRQSEARYRALVDATTHMVWTANAAGEFATEQPDWAAFTGQTFEEYRGLGWTKVLHPEARPRSESLWQRALSSGRLYENECPIRRHDGEYRWFAVRAAPVRDESGAIREWVGTDTDITEQVQARLKIAESEERFRQVAEVAPQFIWVNRADGSLEYVNQRWVDYSGLDLAATADSEQLAAAIHPDDRAEIFSLWQRSVVTGEEFEMEARLRGANGEFRWYLVRTVPLLDESGQVVKWFGSSTDITDRKRAEAALRELNETLEARVAERTAALAQSEEQLRTMASRLTMAEQEERRRISQVLHDDLQQQLYGIQMKLSFARQDFEAGDVDAALESLAEVEEMLDQGVEITRRLTVDLSPPILNTEGLADMLRWLVSEMKEMHDLDVALVAGHPFRIPDEDMRLLLFQIVRELLFNVVKHASAGRASVELHDDDGRLVISVADDGRGFDVSRAAARAAEDGGFGLFNVRERLRLFGGRMHVESTLGRGARIMLDVPLSIA